MPADIYRISTFGTTGLREFIRLDPADPGPPGVGDP